MPSIEYDLRYFQAGLIDLEGYLLSQELYWPIGASAPPGDPPYPRMTLGGLLMSQKRLEAQHLNGDQGLVFERLQKKLDETRSKWRTAWGKKASHEFSARLRLWRDFLEDYRREPEANYDRYGYEVRRRVMLDLLKPDADLVDESELGMLAGLDKLLQAVFLPGEFVWDGELAQAFPRQDYWYLYGQPKRE